MIEEGERTVCDGSTSSSSINIALLPETLNMTIISSEKDPTRKLVFIKSSSSLYLPGYGFITALKGKIVLNGHQLSRHVPYRFSNPKWLPSLDITTKHVSLSSNPSIYSILKKSGLESYFSKPDIATLPNVDDYSIICIQGLEYDELEWIEAADNYTLPVYLMNSSNLINCGSCYMYDDATRVALAMKSLLIPPDWDSACDQLAQHISKQHVKVPVCGAKGSGKSTFIRYSCNRLLNHYRKVCIIDCDLGQPEFTVPGMISMSVIDKPIFSPSFMNVSRVPIISYFIGDITTKNNPDYLFECIRLLYARYLSYVEEELILIKKEQAEIERTNPYEALNDHRFAKKIPLLINCDGNIRFFGEEVLSMIFNITIPTHIVHIVTAKDPQLRPIDHTSASTGCSVIRISPGQLVPSTIHAADMRNLRFISYFLRGRSELKQYTRNSSHHSDHNSVITISNGVIGDIHGRLAMELLRIAPYSVPFDMIRFRFLCDAVPPRLTLASFNAAVVGITDMSPSSSSSSSDMTATAHKFYASSSKTEFSLDISMMRNHMHNIKPCIGIGIIRAVDVQKQVLYITSLTPLHCDKIGLLRGSVILPMSLSYASDLSIHPFVTAEIHGEGSNAMKPRTNVKRKYHQQSS